jgi:hypothetical protein
MYETPKSDLDVDGPKQDYIKLKGEQHQVLGFIACQVSAVFVLAVLAFSSGLVPGFVFFIPGLVSGFVLKVAGKPVTALSRIVPSSFVGGLVFLYFFR